MRPNESLWVGGFGTCESLNFAVCSKTPCPSKMVIPVQVAETLQLLILRAQVALHPEPITHAARCTL